MSRSDNNIVRKISELAPVRRRALLKAVMLLARARLRHATQPIKSVLAGFDTPADRPAATHDEAELVGWALAAAAARVPWRSDCLLQAMAAANWLDQLGRCHSLTIGVRKSAANLVEAHAWLKSGSNIVVGNSSDLASFRPVSGTCEEVGRFDFL